MCPNEKILPNTENDAPSSDDAALLQETESHIREIIEKYKNMSSATLTEIAIEGDPEIADLLTELEQQDADLANANALMNANADKTTKILLPKEAADILPPINGTNGLDASAVKIPFHFLLQDTIDFYVYEYDGKDIVKAYYTCEHGLIIGSSLMSISGLQQLHLVAEEPLLMQNSNELRNFVVRDLAWDTNTTLKTLQDGDYFASEEYIQYNADKVRQKLAAQEHRSDPAPDVFEEVF